MIGKSNDRSLVEIKPLQVALLEEKR